MNHSPGPFVRGESRSCEVEILDARGCVVAHVVPPLGVDRNTDPFDVQEANVRLMAAAPELLKALNKIAFDQIGHAEASDREMLDEITRMAREAVKKANE